MATTKYSDEELNYFRLCYVITHNVPEGLRTVFKQQWNAQYQATHGPWLDVPKNATDLKNMESSRSQRHNARLLTIMANGNTYQWDCTCLLYAIRFSDCLGPFLNTTVKESVDELREIRNEVFAHTADGRLKDGDFEDAMRKVVAAFKALGLGTTQVDDIKTQKSFPTEELCRIQQQLNNEKKRFADFYSFCVLPPKPSHDTTDRADEVMTINHEMEKLRSTKKNETTVIYLSGNPGCGKSEIARQIGSNCFDNIPEESADLKFIFTLNASSIDTLLQSYVDFAARLNCDEDSVTRIATSSNLTPEDKIKQIKSLINPKVQIYSWWLIIADNVNDLKLVSKYLPQAGVKTTGDGQILVTTQDSQSIPLDSYTYHYSSLKEGIKEEDAITLLTQISGIPGDRATLLNIARALDFQPLALACAAVYMKRISDAKWEKYLLKLQVGKREATEEVYTKTTSTYQSGMTAAVKLALKRVVREDKIMMHAFQFLSAIANEPIPLKYVVQYVINCMPDEDQDLVAAHIGLSSLVISSEDVEMSKAVRLHQVVYHGVQKLFENYETYILKLTSVFSDLPYIKNPYNVTKGDIIATRSLVPHFVAISGKLDQQVLDHSNLTHESHTADCLFKAGSICRVQGSYKASEIFLEQCLSIQQRGEFNSGPEIAHDRSINSRSEMNKSHEDWRTHYEGTYSSNDSVVLATTHKWLGFLYRIISDYKKALTHLEAALAIEERLHKGEHPELAITLTGLGSCLHGLKQHGKAEEYLQRALAIQEKGPGKNDHLLADILISLVLLLQSQGELEKAKTYFERVLVVYEQKLCDNESPQLSNTLHNLGLCLANFKDRQKATTFYEKSLKLFESVFHDNHPKRAITLGNIGRCLLALGENERAKSYFEEEIAIYENGEDQNNLLLADALDDLGDCLNKLRQYDKAQPYFDRALSILEEGGDESDKQKASTLFSLGKCFFEQRQYEKAKAYLERALSIREKRKNENENDPHLAENIAITRNNIGLCLIRQKQYEKAKTYLERELSMHEEGSNENDPQLAKIIATTRNNIGECLIRLKQYEKAKAYLERALSIREKGEEGNDPRLS